ncbi:MAG: ThiF family adenylyltransferase [Melioribacteraceae bacterium]
MKKSMCITEKQYKQLQKHLFPGDQKEAIAILLCGVHKAKNRERFLVHKIFMIPYEKCTVRSARRVQWQTDVLKPILDEASQKKLSVFKIHSHDKRFKEFSKIDNVSDKKLFPQIYTWLDSNQNHGSLIMLSCGKLIGRIVREDGKFVEIDSFSKIGNDIVSWTTANNNKIYDDEFALRHRQAFGEDTFKKLHNLKITIVGCSGTGSFVIEQLARLGVGELVLVDPDVVELKNLNRIINSTYNDAIKGKSKVSVLKRAITNMNIGTKVQTFYSNLFNSKVVNEVAGSDIIFGCMDSIDGRHLLNRISNIYLIPYFDLGVKLKADGKGGVEHIVGSVHYLQPGMSTLLSRGLYSQKKLESANLIRTDPDEYQKRLKSKYIDGIVVDSPAVISINNQISSFAVNDFLARIHCYRYNNNSTYAITMFNFCDWDLITESEEKLNQKNTFTKFIGRGDMLPLLNMSALNSSEGSI